MDVTDALLIEVIDSSQVSDARRRITSMAIDQGLDQKTVDRLALVSTEMATNLVKHTPGGFMIAHGLKSADNLGVEIFSLDKGPGMANVNQCLSDGYSTTGTLGTGLGAISRVSDSMEVCSSEGFGTIVQARFWLHKTAEIEKHVNGFTIPLAGEFMSGDQFTTCKINDGLYCIVVDGLGHGFEAAEAAKLAIVFFKENLSLAPAEMILQLHNTLKGTRGAVGAVAKIDFESGRLQYAGLGNISAVLIGLEENKHLPSLNGTLGYEARKITEFSFPWNRHSVLVMHSDGISSRISETLAKLDIQNSSSALIAASLYLHQSKATDDATVLVVKQAV